MAFGSELLLFLGAGFVVLGPKRMQGMIGQLGRAKAQFDQAKRSLMSEVTGERDHDYDKERTPHAGSAQADNQGDTELVLPDELIERILNHRTANP